MGFYGPFSSFNFPFNYCICSLVSNKSLNPQQFLNHYVPPLCLSKDQVHKLNCIYHLYIYVWKEISAQLFCTNYSLVFDTTTLVGHDIHKIFPKPFTFSLLTELSKGKNENLSRRNISKLGSIYPIMLPNNLTKSFSVFI